MAVKRRKSYDAVKRCVDVGLTIAAMPLLLPLMAVIWTITRVSLGSPALFFQKRAGRHGKPIIVIKFRTMAIAHDREGALLSDAKRLSRFGKFLRVTSLDELPQLWNVLTGSMSLVGPRPLLMEYVAHYSPQQSRRHEVRPGLTGLAQISGRNEIDWSDRFALDLWYVDNRTLSLDLKIIWKSVWAVVLLRGARSFDSPPPFAALKAPD